MWGAALMWLWLGLKLVVDLSHSSQWGPTVRTLINSPMGRFAWTNHIYFLITKPGSSTVTPLYQLRLVTCDSLCAVDDSPFKQSILVRNHNAAEEGRTQEQLELYFKAGFLDLQCSAQSDEVAKKRFHGFWRCRTLRFGRKKYMHRMYECCRTISYYKNFGWKEKIRGYRIAWFIEDQTFSQFYDLTPPSSLPSANCLSFSVFLCVAGQGYWRKREEGVGAKSYHGETPGLLNIIQYGTFWKRPRLLFQQSRHLYTVLRIRDFLFTSFIRIHWYTVPPTFQFTVWEDGFDYIVFFFQMGILNMIQHFMHKY
jgi:hypothetical protein